MRLPAWFDLIKRTQESFSLLPVCALEIFSTYNFPSAPLLLFMCACVWFFLHLRLREFTWMGNRNLFFILHCRRGLKGQFFLGSFRSFQNRWRAIVYDANKYLVEFFKYFRMFSGTHVIFILFIVYNFSRYPRQFYFREWISDTIS